MPGHGILTAVDKCTMLDTGTKSLRKTTGGKGSKAKTPSTTPKKNKAAVPVLRSTGKSPSKFAAREQKNDADSITASQAAEAAALAEIEEIKRKLAFHDTGAAGDKVRTILHGLCGLREQRRRRRSCKPREF